MQAFFLVLTPQNIARVNPYGSILLQKQNVQFFSPGKPLVLFQYIWRQYIPVHFRRKGAQ